MPPPTEIPARTVRPIDGVRRMLADLLGGPDASIAHRRAQAAAFAASQPPLPAGLTVTLETRGGVPVERLEPQAATALTLLHLHGGGYVMGDPAGSRGLTTRLALTTPATVFSVDYRLAPRHPFPAAVQDAVAVYADLITHGADPARTALIGESAGGGLAVATLVAARDQGLPMPAACVALSPWTDLACEGSSHTTLHGRDPLLTRDVLLEMAALYLCGHSPADPLASPATADLTGLPPLLIQAGSEEVLRDDAVRLAEAARACGVAADLRIWPEMIHVWQMFGDLLPDAEAAIAEIRSFLLSTTA
ncbi:alpha/beta hydrolase [Phenylobacterium sp.]|uniref:alpha/beta hydrolase n=1 Tax=Phenylobacterium sp. TaxID=1871053 RepID=UPI0035626BEB